MVRVVSYCRIVGQLIWMRHPHKHGFVELLKEIGGVGYVRERSRTGEPSVYLVTLSHAVVVVVG